MGVKIAATQHNSNPWFGRSPSTSPILVLGCLKNAVRLFCANLVEVRPQICTGLSMSPWLWEDEWVCWPKLVRTVASKACLHCQTSSCVLVVCESTRTRTKCWRSEKVLKPFPPNMQQVLNMYTSRSGRNGLNGDRMMQRELYCVHNLLKNIVSHFVFWILLQI